MVTNIEAQHSLISELFGECKKEFRSCDYRGFRAKADNGWEKSFIVDMGFNNHLPDDRGFHVCIDVYAGGAGHFEVHKFSDLHEAIAFMGQRFMQIS